MSKDPFKKVLQQEQQALKQDLLHDLPVERIPERIDWLARYIALNGGYMLRQPSGKQTHLDRDNFDKAVRQPYLAGLSNATGATGYLNALDNQYPLGSLIIQYAGLIEGLSRINESGVDPGEALGRLIAREIRRNSEGKAANIASEFQVETYTPRGLVEQVVTHPELAETVESVMPSGDATVELVDQLGEIKIATQLWDHQLMALCEWIHQGANGYVNMATATGKTVLGLAAVAYCTDSGALHPSDAAELTEWFEPKAPLQPDSTRPSDVLIVTTDELLGVQWARLFEDHCNTPSEFTEIVDQTISLPWGDIHIRSANAVGNTDPSDYRVAIFDEVHNYTSGGGWGEDLAMYIDSDCPVLALTGSVTDEIKRHFQQVESAFPCVYTYTHEYALKDGVIPEFNWTLQYTPIDKTQSSTAKTLRETAQLIEENVMWDGSSYRLKESEIDIQSLPSEQRAEVTEPHESPVSFGRTLSNGEESSAVPDELLRLANGMSNRLTYWWNLRLETQSIINLVRGAMANGQPTLVLSRSYKEGDRLYKQLQQACDDIRIQKLEGDEDADSQDKRITTFDDWETNQKVLIGPGDRVGTGNDIQSVEVGINLARPGTGMSNSLIQRLGRLLRQPNKKECVDFYHLLGIPPVESIAPMDGEHFVRDSAGFFAQTKTTGNSGQMVKVPQIRILPEVKESIQQLERYGCKALTSSDAPLNQYEQAYFESIMAASGDQTVVDTDWYQDLFDETAVATSSSSLTEQEGELNDYDESDGNLDNQDITLLDEKLGHKGSASIVARNKSVSSEEGSAQTGNSDSIDENKTSGSNSKSQPKAADSIKRSERAVEEQFRAATESTAKAVAADTTSAVVLRLQRCFCNTDKKVVYNAVDPSDDQIWLVIRGHPEKKFDSKQCYRFTDVDVSPAFGEESYEVHVSADSTIKQLTGDIDGEPSTQAMRIEKAADQLLINDRDNLPTEIQKLAKETGKKIHKFDLQHVDIQTGLDQLHAIRSNLNVIPADRAGVDSARLDNIKTRVGGQAMKLDKLKQVLITVQRNITLANENSTIPVQSLQEADEDLQAAISTTQELGRDATQLKNLREDISELLKDTSEPEPTPVSDPDPNAPIDHGSGIQANEISEYYEALWNLKQLTATVQTVVDDIDEPMKQWCSFVKAFLVGKIDEYPNYGKLQLDFNEFAISTYRDVYGDGERTTEYHVINVEPPTATVQQLITNSSQLPATDLDIPIAPESEVRLPVIVETEAELDRATALLKEIPKSPSKAVLLQKNEENEDGNDIEKNDDKEENSGHKTGDGEPSGVDSVGEPPSEKPDDEAPLTDIGGVTEDVANALRDADITTREQLTKIDLNSLAEINGISNAIAQRIKMQVG